MGRLNGGLIAVLIGKDGQVRIYSLTDDGATISGTELRRFAVGSQSEGCAVDDAAGQLYIGEEMKGVWRYPLDGQNAGRALVRSEEHTSELQSLMRSSYAVFCLKKKLTQNIQQGIEATSSIM